MSHAVDDRDLIANATSRQGRRISLLHRPATPV